MTMKMELHTIGFLFNQKRFLAPQIYACMNTQGVFAFVGRLGIPSTSYRLVKRNPPTLFVNVSI